MLHPDGRLEARAPADMDGSTIMKFVLQSRNWIKTKLREQRVRSGTEKPPADLPPGEQFIRCGGEDVHYTVTRSSRRKSVGLVLHPDGRLEIKVPSDMDDATIRLYAARRRSWVASKLREQRARESKEVPSVKRTEESIVSRAVELARWMHMPAPNVSIRAMRSAWGRCNERGDIILHPALTRVPDAVADYVIIHELCHMVIPNHSPRYWKMVARYCPEYERHKRWLDDHSSVLS